ncbi:MAG: helix-turn-helix transcriptional regulator [Actinobacteria bacterium]|nr:helix-turn-helix transcriptional regulator [Actinomycetota bacterium]
MSFGQRLKQLRIERGQTQRQLAEPVYTDAYVSAVEAGRRTPSAEALHHFAQKLEVGEEQLLTGRPPDLTARLELELQAARRTVSSGHIEAAQASFTRISAEAKTFDLVRLEARAEQGKGLCAMSNGDLEGAIALFEGAAGLLQDEPATSRVDAVAAKATCLRRMGDLRYAIYLLENLLETLERKGLSDPNSLLKIYASLVPPYFESGAYAQAAAAAQKALQLAPRASDPERIGDMHINVARVHLSNGRVADAERSLHQATELYRELDLQYEIGISHFAWGYVLSRQNQPEEARIELERAKQIFSATHNRFDEAGVGHELARIARQAGDVKKARTLLQECAGLLEGSSDVADLASAHRELALLDLDEDPTLAEKNLRQAIELYERGEFKVEVAVTYRILGDLFHGQGKCDLACETYRSGILGLEDRL